MVVCCGPRCGLKTVTELPGRESVWLHVQIICDLLVIVKEIDCGSIQILDLDLTEGVRQH